MVYISCGMNAIQRTTYIMYQPPNLSDRNMTCHTINRTPFTIRKNNNRMAFIFKFSYYCCPLKLKGSSPPYPQCRQTGIADSFFEK